MVRKQPRPCLVCVHVCGVLGARPCSRLQRRLRGDPAPLLDLGAPHSLTLHRTWRLTGSVPAPSSGSAAALWCPRGRPTSGSCRLDPQRAPLAPTSCARHSRSKPHALSSAECIEGSRLGCSVCVSDDAENSQPSVVRAQPLTCPRPSIAETTHARLWCPSLYLGDCSAPESLVRFQTPHASVFNNAC